MAKRVQLLRHTGTASDAFTGKEGELTYDITNKKGKFHDGSTPGGISIARQDLVNVSAATTSVAGKMSAADKAKLDGIEAGAEVNPDAAEIKSLYESNADTNAFTDTEVSIVAAAAGHISNTSNPHSTTATQLGVEEGAEVNPDPVTLNELIAGTETEERTLVPSIVYQAIQQIAGNVGDIKIGIYDPTALPSGWIFMFNSSTGAAITIGDASSSATHAHADFETLFTRAYNRYADSQAPVSGGRGADAAADWAAHKRITLPNPSGRALVGSNPGAHDSLSIRVPGVIFGTETHLLTAAQSGVPAHLHNFNMDIVGGQAGSGTNYMQQGATNQTYIDANTPADAAEAHPNVQPSIAFDIIIKYK